MAHAVIHHFPGGTQEQYDAAVGALHPSKTQLPAGQIFHVAGATPNGWTIVAVSKTKEEWETFRDTILRPRLGAGVPGAFHGPPEEIEFEAYALLP